MDANIAAGPSDSPAIWLSAFKVVFAPELIGLRDRSAFLCQVSLMSVMNFCAAQLLRVLRLRGWKEDRHWKPKKALPKIGQRLSFVISVSVCVCVCVWGSAGPRPSDYHFLLCDPLKFGPNTCVFITCTAVTHKVKETFLCRHLLHNYALILTPTDRM